MHGRRVAIYNGEMIVLRYLYVVALIVWVGGLVAAGVHPLEHYFARFQHIGERTHYSVLADRMLFLSLDSNFGRMSAEKERDQNA